MIMECMTAGFSGYKGGEGYDVVDAWLMLTMVVAWAAAKGLGARRRRAGFYLN